MSLSYSLTALLILSLIMGYIFKKYVFRFFRDNETLNKLSNVMTFDKILDDNKTIQCFEGYARLIELHGINLSPLKTTEIEKIIKLRADFLKSLEDFSLTIRCFTLRKSLTLKNEEFNEKTFIGLYAKKWFQSIKSSYFNKHYLLIYSQKREELDTAYNLISSNLHDYAPQEILLEDEAASFSPLLSVLYELMTGEDRLIAPTKNIKEALCCFSISFDDDGFIAIENNFSKTFRGIATVKSWGDTTDIEIIKSLSNIPANLLINLRLKPYSKLEAIAKENYKIGQIQKLRPNTSTAEEFNEIIELLERGEISIIKSEVSFLVSGESKQAVLDIFKRIEQTLSGYSVMIIREKLMAQRTFWASLLPEFDDIWSREYELTNNNISELTPWIKDETGATKCDWGDRPVCYFPIHGSRNPYGFIFHSNEGKGVPGHIGIFGQTGCGKTVLIEHLITTALNNFPDLFIYAFDKDNGLKVFSEFLPDATYLSISSGGFNFNPFDCPNTPENIAFIENFITSVLSDCKEGETLKAVSSTINSLFNFTESNRNMRGFLELLPRCSLSADLQKYNSTQRFGQIFTDKRDLFNNVSSRVTFFPMDLIIQDKELAAPMMYYILNKLPKQAIKEAKPFLIVVDEAASLLTNENMCNAVERWIQTQRKNRGTVALLFQEAEALLEEHISKTIISNLVSYFIFPGSIKTDEACDLLNLTDRERKFAKGEIRIGKRVVLLKKSTGESVYLDVDLSPVGGLLKAFEGGVKSAKKLREAKENLPTGYNQIDLLNAYIAVGD